MHYAVRRFASRVVLAHVAVFLVLLGVVYYASHEVYKQAREQALDEAKERQELLAGQTGRAVQAFYDAIFSDLELLHPANPEDPNGRFVGPRATSRPGRPPARGGRGAFMAAGLLSHQLEGRVAYLFTIDKTTLKTPWTGIGADETAPTVREVAERCGPLVKALDKPAILPFQLFGDRGMSLVCAPVGENAATVLVAAVPGRRLEHQFLEDLNKSDGAAFLIDEGMTVMTASRPGLAGADLTASADPQLKAALDSLGPEGLRGTRPLERPFTLATENIGPSLVTVEPIPVSDKRWLLLIASPLADVDGIVRGLFRRVVWWAAFLAAAIMAVLASTAAQLIRGRLRLDRVRHELIDRQLRHAREIQLAWLPDRCDRSGRPVDIATVNHPASHISGDFYNFFDLPDGRTAICIGDVTGHGMSAAFLMATTQLLIRNTLARLGDPSRCMEEVNHQLCQQAFNGQFVTMQILVLDVHHGKLHVVTAGHPAAPLVGDGESFQPLPLEPQLVLGVDRDATYPAETYPLAPGSGILLYTDGVGDAQRTDGERFGADRLRRSLYGRFASAQAMLDTVLSAIDQFRAGYDLGDDLTLVAIQLQPAAAREKPHPTPATA